MKLPNEENIYSTTLKFGSWTYDGDKLDVDLYNDLELIDMSDYSTFNGYEIKGNYARKDVVYYTCCVEPYPNLSFTLDFKEDVEMS